MLQTIAVVGAGALGTMYAHRFVERLGKAAVLVVTDPARRRKYETSGVLANGKPCDFTYFDGTEPHGPVDFILFAVKYGGLDAAIKEAAPIVDGHTVVLSVMNGITSEDKLAAAFGDAHVLLCTAQGMDSTRRGNDTTYTSVGNLWFGARRDGQQEDCDAVAELLLRAGIDFELAEDMPLRMWKKLMMNVGVNQATAVFDTGYGGVKVPGEARDVMVAAMRETKDVANAAGIPLTEDDIDFWMELTNHFSDDGMPSMRQDLLAGRPTEVELFAGTIRKLAKEYHIAVPVNDLLYKLIKGMETKA